MVGIDRNRLVLREKQIWKAWNGRIGLERLEWAGTGLEWEDLFEKDGIVKSGLEWKDSRLGMTGIVITGLEWRNNRCGKVRIYRNRLGMER